MDEQNLPIDIQLKKLLDWLFSRRICNREWHQSIVQIREKIGHAIGDMPEHAAIKTLLTGTNINYFHCQQIIEILKETEKDSKTFFGSYGSQRMKDWQEVVKLYERENIYLAEAAQLLSQSVTFDIPGLKKQLAKSIQVQEECDKKEKDNLRKTKEFRNEFEKSCKELGISGAKIRKEIIELLRELPDTYEEIAGNCKNLKEALNFYSDFLKSTLKPEGFNSSEVLSTITFLVNHGNITTYEWMYGEAPLSIEEPTLHFEEEQEEQEEGEEKIDFGDDQEIDFSAVDDVELDTGTDIDWGNLDSNEVDENAADEIDFETEDNLNVEIEVEDGGVAGGVARESEALTLLDNRKTRTLILDELTELQCFLEQRLVELHSAEDGKFTLATNIAKNENESFLSANINRIAELISSLNTGKLHQLQLIRESPKYVERLVDKLKSKLALVDKVSVSNQVLQERRDIAIQEQAEHQRRLELLKIKAKELQREIEKDISKRYKDRPVNIMGGVQSV